MALEKKPEVSDHVHELVEGIDHFTIDFYKQIAASPGNIVVSPFNVSTALSIPYLGAHNATAEQMESTLHFPSDTPEELAKSFEDLLNMLAVSSDEVALEFANSLWVQETYPVLFLFKSLVKRSYKGGIQQVNFANFNQAAKEINEWAATETNGRIEQLIQHGSIDAATRAVVASAIYFQAPWMLPFDVEETKVKPFYVTVEKEVAAPTMHKTVRVPYAKDEGYSLLALPYKAVEDGPGLAMLLILPDHPSGLHALERELSFKMIEKAMLQMNLTPVAISMPRFRLATRIYARKFLEKMGMIAPFSTKANFSGITGHDDLSIDAVIHQAYIDVDDAGTEAAAATAVSMGLKSAPLKPEATFTANHPFLYIIFDLTTGQFLFIGRVVDPIGA